MDKANLKIFLSVEEVSRNEVNEVVVKSMNFRVKTFMTPKPPVRIRVHIVNVGKRPVTPQCYFLFERSSSINMRVYEARLSPQRKLEEGENLEFIHNELRIWLGDTNGLAVEDTSGKEWKLPQVEFNKMKKLIQDYGLAQ